MKNTLPILAVALLFQAPWLHGQWLTQTNSLLAGWNGVYLHVDPSHADMGELVNVLDPIEEIWLWNAELPPGQALAIPPMPQGSQWSTWTRAEGPASVLQTLRGNSAMLVRVADGTPSFEWRVKGRPVAPVYRWTLNGLNFVGFPTTIPAPTFESFLAADAQPLDWEQSAEIYRYRGGDLRNNNPTLVSPFVYRSTPVVRSQAYWVRTGEVTNQFFNRYFGPFQVKGAQAGELDFGEERGQTRLYLRNMTPSPLTLTLQQIPTETPPTGQAEVAGLLPLLLRGSINLTNLSFGFVDLTTATHQWTLAPAGTEGSQIEVILGLNRSQMTAAPGSTYAGVLRFTDSRGLSRVDIGASAVTATRAGLWVGRASVNSVSQYLKPYATTTNEADLESLLANLGLGQGVDGYRYQWDEATGRVLVFGGPEERTGSYLLEGPIKLEAAQVARPFPLRLIVHHDGTTAKLLQRAYLGLGSQSNLVVATRQEALLASDLANARRVSAIHLPTTDLNQPWNFTGTMREGSTMTTQVRVSFDDHGSNPFLHTYHPDHDNLDPLFSRTLAAGMESYSVVRDLSLSFTPPDDTFDSLTRSAAQLVGNYIETVTFQTPNGPGKQISALGRFSLARVSAVATLTTDP